ncbi:hypothetical protein AVBRAN12654_03185 [Campylobacter sp. RM12654]|uniref:hypothetical protein n=1 Tax=Campylobacter sp. RM12654 TaxID=2735738 RepID=UPI0030146943|nr:hypothetical protein [Campylobacter sp. RM12654]
MRLELLFSVKEKLREGNKSVLVKDTRNITNIIEERLNRLENGKKCYKGIVIEDKLAMKHAILFKFKINGKSLDKATLLDRFYKDIKDGEHRKEYHITVVYSDSSLYFSEKLYKLISKHEIMFRKLIYLLMIGACGDNWYKIVDENIARDKRQDKTNQDLNEAFLSLLTYQDYINGFFQLTYPNNLEELMEEAKKELDNNNKEKAMEKLQKIARKPHIEHWYENLKVDKLKEDLLTIQKIRNKIAHNHAICLKDYKEYEKTIKAVIKRLEKEIEKVEKEKYMSLKINSIDIYARYMKELTSRYENAFKNIGKLADYQTKLSEMISLPNKIVQNQFDIASKLSKIYIPSFSFTNPLLELLREQEELMVDKKE